MATLIVHGYVLQVCSYQRLILYFLMWPRVYGAMMMFLAAIKGPCECSVEISLETLPLADAVP